MTNGGGRLYARLGVAALVLASCLAAAGCSPRWVSVTAVYLDDGHPAVLFAPCGGTRVASIALMQHEPDGPSASNSGLFWNVADIDGRHPITQTRLMDPPPGWAEEPGLPGTRITELRDDRSYTVWGTSDHPAAGRLDLVDFTLAGLRALAPGQVWAPPKALEPEQAMTRDEFTRHAAASC